MPLDWKISHADRLVTMTAAGQVTLKDAEAYLDAIVVAGAMPYAKLVDCSGMFTEVTDEEMMMLGARMQAYVTTLQGGPLAFVVTRPDVRDYVLRYLNLSTGAKRPVEIFENADAARRWLDGQKA
jgi:hypothetical protein